MNLEKINKNRHILISIHDHDGVRVGFLDNEKPGALHYYNDSWHRYLTEGSATFDFTVWKGDGQDVSLLNEEAYISFSFEYHEHFFKVRKIEETETELTCYCESTNLELLNEDSPVYESTKEYSLAEYFELGHLVGDARLSNVVLGVNQVSDVKKKLSWSGTESKLARLLSIVHSFDAECEFVTELNRNGTLNCLKINVYKKHDDEYQGVGTRRVGKTLYYGEGINSIRRTVDITNIVSSITPTGSKEVEVKTEDKNGNETTSKETQTVTLADYNPDKVYDSDKHLLYYVENGAIWAPQTRDRFPATLTPDSDKWIVQAYQTDGTTQKEVYELGLERLKVLSEPAIEYEIEGDYDLEIGDTITINDQKFNPPLLLEARVSEQEYCFTDPTQCRNVFSNVKALENKLSLSIQNRMQELIDEATPITLEVTIEGSTVMKSGSGSSAVLTGRLSKGENEIYADSWAWFKDGEQVSTSPIITIDADDISGSSVYRVEAVKGARTYKKTVTMTQVKDGLSIADLKDQHTLSSSTSTNDGSDWSDSTVEYVDGKAVWSRYEITWDDGSKTYTSALYNPSATVGYQASFRCGELEADMLSTQSAISTAQTTADTAMSTADGKNTVYRQSTKPSTSNRKTGDIWFDTANDNRIYIWSGSAWTLSELGEDAIANLAITNAKIADATIQSAKIANLDAGKITTGTLDANRIAAGSLSVGKLSDLSVSGRNLVVDGELSKTKANTNFTKGSGVFPASWDYYNTGLSNYQNIYAVYIDQDTFGYNVAVFNESDGTRHWKALTKSIVDGWGFDGTWDHYRLSIDVYATGTGTKLTGGFYYARPEDNGNRDFRSGQFSIPSSKISVGEWSRVSVEIPYNHDWDGTSAVKFFLYGHNFSANEILHVKNISINNATVTCDFTRNTGEISVENIYTAGTTTIDGGKITTGSIVASKIAANAITSDKIDATNLEVNHVISKNSDEIKTYEIVDGQAKYYAPNSGSAELISKTTYGYSDDGYAEHQLTLNSGIGFSLGVRQSGTFENYTGATDNINRYNYFHVANNMYSVFLQTPGTLYLGGGTGSIYGIETSGTVNRDIGFTVNTSAVTSKNSDSWNTVIANTVTKTATLHFHLSGSFASNTDTLILTIKNTSYCPKKRVWGSGYTGANPFYINVGTDGEVYVKCGSSALSEIRGTVSWAYGGFEQ